MATVSCCFRRPAVAFFSLPARVHFRSISTQISRPAHTLAHRQPHVLIVGGSYGGLSTLNSLIDLSNGRAQPKSPHNLPEIGRPLPLKPRYTVLDLKDGFYHTAGAPLAQISPAHAREFWVSYDEFRANEMDDEHIDFIQGKATTLDSEVKMLSYVDTKGLTKRLAYDYMVIATGVQRNFPVVPRATNRIQYLADVERFSLQLKSADRIVIVGGGMSKANFLFIFILGLGCECTNLVLNRCRRRSDGRRSQVQLPPSPRYPRTLGRPTTERRTAS
jgi:Pyridine nucleotide-disulphide oxidoreductase